jgi:hypothetical protein
MKIRCLYLSWKCQSGNKLRPKITSKSMITGLPWSLKRMLKSNRRKRMKSKTALEVATSSKTVDLEAATTTEVVVASEVAVEDTATMIETMKACTLQPSTTRTHSMKMNSAGSSRATSTTKPTWTLMTPC